MSKTKTTLMECNSTMCAKVQILFLHKKQDDSVINLQRFNRNLGGHFRVRFQVGGWVGVKLLPSLKLVKIFLETLNLARKYTPIFSFRNYFFLVPRPP